MDVGINMVLVEVYIRVIEEVAIVIPFDLEPEVVETEIPISYLLVVGDVPMYYYDGKGQPSEATVRKHPPCPCRCCRHRGSQFLGQRQL